MVHVNNCPHPNGRGHASIEFFIGHKPQKYCYGWKDSRTDEVVECCRNCKDWVFGEQCDIDFEKARKQKNDS